MFKSPGASQGTSAKTFPSGLGEAHEYMLPQYEQEHSLATGLNDEDVDLGVFRETVTNDATAGSS